MSAQAPPAPVLTAPAGDPQLARDLLVHLDAQLDSARRLLSVVLEQAAAIRARDVQVVVRCAGAMQVEMRRRVAIEQKRSILLQRAGARLGVTATSVTLDMFTVLIDPASAEIARHRSAELRGMLEEIKREHTINRVLIQQELAFLNHLLRLVDGEGSGAYDAAGERPTSDPTPVMRRRRVFDLEV